MALPKTAKIYLEGWQKKLIKDTLKVDCDYCEIHPTDEAKIVRYMGPKVLKYMGPPNAKVGQQRMYLTEWQRREIRDLFGAAQDYFELVKNGTICMYKGPPAAKARG